MARPRVVFMGKDKDSVIEAFYNLFFSEVDIISVVVDSESSEICDVARRFNIPVYNSVDIYDHIAAKNLINRGLKDIDLVISFLFPKRIKNPLINVAKLGCINFHSAPLPKYRGWGVYNAAILNNEKQWGVSAHFVDENFDTGDIIKVNHFDIDPQKETAHSLEKKSQEQLLKLFDEVIGMVVNGKELPRTPQKAEDGITYTKKDTLKHEIVTKDDSDEMIDRKIRAFWFPPFSAKIELNGKNYSLISKEVIDSIAKA